MPISRSLDYVLLDMIEASQRSIRVAPMNLGGIPGSGGGEGAPPGGFIGWLPQTRVAYDTDELATLATPSGGSLLDNLNHIRYRIEQLEASSGILTVIDDNTPSTYNLVDTIHFSGAGITVTDLGSGDIKVSVTATGSGGGAALTVKEADGSPIVTNVDTIVFSGMTVVDQGGGDALVYPTSTYFDTRYLKLDASNDPITGTLTIEPTATYTDALIAQVDSDAIAATLNQITVNTDITSPGVLIQRQSTGTGNITSALLDLREYDFGAGVITGDFVKFSHEGSTVFTVTRSGTVDIAASQEYKIGGVAVVTSTKTGVSGGDSHDHNGGDGATIVEAAITLADNTTNNASTATHGFLKKLSNVLNEFMNGQGDWRTITQEIVFGGHGNGGSVPASSTNYICPMVAGIDTVGRSYPIPLPGTLKNLYFRLASAQPASGSLVLEIFAGSTGTTATGIKITIAAGGAAGTYSDTTHTFTHTAGDLVTVKVINNATGASGILGGISFSLSSTIP